MGLINPTEGENGVHIKGVLCVDINDPHKVLQPLLELIKKPRSSTLDKTIRLLADIEAKQKTYPDGVHFSSEKAECYVKQFNRIEGGSGTILPMLVEAGLLHLVSKGGTYKGQASRYLVTAHGWEGIAKPLPKTKARLAKSYQRVRNADPVLRHMEWTFERITHNTPNILNEKDLIHLAKVLAGKEQPKITLTKNRYYWNSCTVRKDIRRGLRFDGESGVELDIKTALPCMIPCIVNEQGEKSNELIAELGHLIRILEECDIYEEFAPEGETRDATKRAFNAILNGGDRPGVYACIKKKFRAEFPMIWGRLNSIIRSKAFTARASLHLAEALRLIFKELEKKKIPALLYSDCLHVPESKAEEVREIMLRNLRIYSGVEMRVERKNVAPAQTVVLEDNEPTPPSVIDPWHPWVPLDFTAAEALWRERFSAEGRDFKFLARTFAGFLNYSDTHNTPKTKQKLEMYMSRHLPMREEIAAA